MAILVGDRGRITVFSNVANYESPQISPVRDYPGESPDNHLYGVWTDKEPGGVVMAVGANSFMVKGQKNAANRSIGWERFAGPDAGDLKGVAKRDKWWFVVGTKGIFVHNGTNWQQSAIPNSAGEVWKAIWLDPVAQTILAVSSKGRLWHIPDNSLNGTAIPLPETENKVALNAIWGSSLASFYIVGDGGMILSCGMTQGQPGSAKCHRQVSSFTQKLSGVFGTKDSLGAEIVYAVGVGPTFVRKDPGGWQVKAPFGPSESDLNAIAGEPSGTDDRILAVGPNGHVYRRHLSLRGRIRP